MTTAKLSNVTIAILLLVVIPNCEGREVDSSVNAPKRSKRWDAYIQSLKDAHKERRVRRQVGAYEWESDRRYCNPAEYTAYDSHLRRRASRMLAPVQYQGMCGSCWAFASAHTLTDQLRLDGDYNHPLLSANHLTLCNKNTTTVARGNGCCGARSLIAGPLFFSKSGAATDSCLPYNRRLEDFIKGRSTLPTCPRTCFNGASLNLFSFANLHGWLPQSNQDIKQALEDGSVVLAGMRTTAEFKEMYECGIYHDSGRPTTGQHAVEIVDYGRSQYGTDFWVVKNSWGVDRQENGYFRIAMGHLSIGNPAIVLSIPLNTGFSSIPHIPGSFGSCTLESVDNPSSNEMVLCVEQFVRQELIEMNLVTCDNGEMASNLTLDFIESAETQVVAGTVVEVDFMADVIGCEEETIADISATVIVDLDGMFVLESHSINITATNGSAGGTVSLSWSLLLLAAVLIILVM